MATGTLGAPVMLAANVSTQLCQVAAGGGAVINVNMVNKTKTPVLVGIAITRANTPGPEDWIEFETYLTECGTPANGHVLERSALAVEGGSKVFVIANAAGAVAARAFGVEK